MEFDLEYKLQQFRKAQSGYYDESGKRYSNTPISNENAELMLDIINELESALAKAETSENALPTHVIIARFLKEQATEYKTEQQNIVVGLIQDDLYVWDFDGGRSMQNQWQTKKVIDDPLNGL